MAVQLTTLIARLVESESFHWHAEAKITYMGITGDTRKVALLKSWAGRTLLNFWEKEARIQLEKIPRIPAAKRRLYLQTHSKTLSGKTRQNC